MSKKFIPKSISILSLIENTFDIVNIFKYKDTSSWINIKNYLYDLSLDGIVSSSFSKKDIISKNGLYLIFISIWHYVCNILNRKKRILFIGAGSGLFFHDNKTLDSYFPMDEKENDIIYMLSADHAENLIKHKSFLKKNKVVIYSYLIGPLKIIFTKLDKLFNKSNIDKLFLQFLKTNDINVSEKELQLVHLKFRISLFLYKLFLFSLNIKKAYIVSAYSNTEICAVLKSRGIEIIELQHGVIGNIHRAYNYEIKNKFLPTADKINVYNSFWKKELIVAGYFSESQIYITDRLKYKLIDLSMKSSNTIVFTGQGGFYNEIIDLFKSSNEYLITKDIIFLYIPHPNETKESLELLKSNSANFKNIFIIEEKEYTTEQYIYNSIAHLSVYSSCHFDSVHYKDKTYILDVMDNNPMAYYSLQFNKIFVNIKKIEEIYLC
ncbi:MAG: hypothetical protein MJK08_12915 [Campylobacterales bacterium]|nr:hypothetical protein [Campylobacterales bacterium]